MKLEDFNYFHFLSVGAICFALMVISVSCEEEKTEREQIKLQILQEQNKLLELEKQ